MARQRWNPLENRITLFFKSWLNNYKGIKVVFKKLKKGMKAGYDFTNKTFLMPKINYYALGEFESKKLTGLAYHELKHALMTDSEPYIIAYKRIDNPDYDSSDPKSKKQISQYKRLQQDLLQIIEDCRIELSPHYMLEGALQDLKWYRISIGLQEYLDMWMKLLIKNPFGAIMASTQFKHCRYGHLPLPPAFQEYSDAALAILNDGRFDAACQMKKEGTLVSWELAQEIYQLWIDMNKNKNQNQDKDDSDQDEDDSDDSDDSEDMEGEYEDADDESSLDFDKFDKESKQAQEEQEASGKCKPNGGNDSNKKGKCNIDEIDYSGDYVPYCVDDRVLFAKEFPEQFNKTHNLISNRINHVKCELARVINSKQEEDWDRDLKRGSLDSTRLHRLCQGINKVFYHREEEEILSTAFQIVIDLSGSMASGYNDTSSRAQLAMQVAILFGEALAAMNTPLEIIGYNTSSAKENVSSLEKSGFDRFDICNHWIFKAFDEPYHKVKYRLGAADQSMSSYSSDPGTGGACGGANIDHETILWGASRLWKQETNRKVQLVLCDGLPAGHVNYGVHLPNMLRFVNERIVNSGIEQFAFSIQCDSAKNYYHNCDVIQNLNDLTQSSLDLLTKYLTMGKFR